MQPDFERRTAAHPQADTKEGWSEVVVKLWLIKIAEPKSGSLFNASYGYTRVGQADQGLVCCSMSGEQLCKLERLAADVAERRRSLPPRPASCKVTVCSDCAGQGATAQALAHLGLATTYVLATEIDPAKRQLLQVVHQTTGCRVGKVLPCVPLDMIQIQSVSVLSDNTPHAVCVGVHACVCVCACVCRVCVCGCV